MRFTREIWSFAQVWRRILTLSPQTDHLNELTERKTHREEKEINDSCMFPWSFTFMTLRPQIEFPLRKVFARNQISSDSDIETWSTQKECPKTTGRRKEEESKYGHRKPDTKQISFLTNEWVKSWKGYVGEKNECALPFPQFSNPSTRKGSEMVRLPVLIVPVTLRWRNVLSFSRVSPL